MSSFISKFLDFTAELESPTSFFLWSAITTIGAVMRDNCYAVEGPDADRVFPNLYVLLFAKSSVVKKGKPLRISARLVNKVGNTTVISGRASLPGVIKLLSEIKTDATGKIIKGASCFLHSEELSSFLVSDDQSIDILTDWYDYHEKWDNVLSGTGVTHLNKLCVTMLAGTNDELAKDIFTRKAIYGGLLARLLVIHEEKKRRKNSLMYTLPNNELGNELLSHLKEIAVQSGEILMDEDAKTEYDGWYNSLQDDKHKSNTGVEGRIPTTVKKVSMILMKSENPELMVIRKDHVQEAINLCSALLPNYNRFSAGAGKGLIAEPGKVLLFRLLDAEGYRLSHPEILAGYWGELDLEILAKTVETFQQAGILEITNVGNTVYYQLTRKAIEGYAKKMEAQA